MLKCQIYLAVVLESRLLSTHLGPGEQLHFLACPAQHRPGPTEDDMFPLQWEERHQHPFSQRKLHICVTDLLIRSFHWSPEHLVQVGCESPGLPGDASAARQWMRALVRSSLGAGLISPAIVHLRHCPPSLPPFGNVETLAIV